MIRLYEHSEPVKAFNLMLGKHHKELRESLNVSIWGQAEMLRADGHSIHRSTIWRFENGERCLSVAAITLLYRSLGLNFPSEVIEVLPLPILKEKTKRRASKTLSINISQLR